MDDFRCLAHMEADVVRRQREADRMGQCLARMGVIAGLSVDRQMVVARHLEELLAVLAR